MLIGGVMDGLGAEIPAPKRFRIEVHGLRFGDLKGFEPREKLLSVTVPLSSRIPTSRSARPGGRERVRDPKA